MNGVTKAPTIKEIIDKKIRILKDFEVIQYQVTEDYIRRQLEKVAFGRPYDNALRAIDIYTDDLILKKLLEEEEDNA